MGFKEWLKRNTIPDVKSDFGERNKIPDIEGNVSKKDELIHKDEIPQIWDCYGPLRTMVSIRAIKNMEDAIEPIDAIIPHVVAGKTKGLSQNDWKKAIKGFLKFYVFLGFVVQCGEGGRFGFENMKKAARGAFFLIHKYNRLYPSEPIFFDYIMAEAQNEKFKGTPICRPMVGGVCTDDGFRSDKDSVLQGIAAEYYIVNNILKNKIYKYEQGDYGDETWALVKRAVDSYGAIYKKIIKLDFPALSSDEWADLFIIWGIKSFEIQKLQKAARVDPYNEAIWRVLDYRFNVKKMCSEVDVCSEVVKVERFIKKDIKTSVKLEKIAKLEIQYAEETFSFCKAAAGNRDEHRSVECLAVIHAGIQHLVESKITPQAVPLLDTYISELIKENYSLDMIYYTSSPSKYFLIEPTDAMNIDEWNDSRQDVSMYKEMIKKEKQYFCEEESDIDKVMRAVSEIIILFLARGIRPEFSFRNMYGNLHNFCNELEEMLL